MDAEFLREFLPDDSNLHVTHVQFGPDAATVEIAVATATADCPRCGQASEQVHSRYTRRVSDLPCCGRALTIDITARKFRCGNPACPRSIFCERLPALAAAHARTTDPLTDSHRAIGFAAGGEAGARLAERLAMPTSPDTLLRRVKAAPEEVAPPPRYVGVDDWAWKKGHRYGTILIDLGRGRVIDILPGRDGEALKAWLRDHPNVEVITRDRWQAFARAATEAAPQALALADQFVGMVRKQRPQPLADWLVSTEQSTCAELRGFAKGIRQDEAAVAAALTEPWSNGPVEGHVNRLKFIRCAGFGRAGFPLLRARVRQAA